MTHILLELFYFDGEDDRGLRLVDLYDSKEAAEAEASRLRATAGKTIRGKSYSASTVFVILPVMGG